MLEILRLFSCKFRLRVELKFDSLYKGLFLFMSLSTKQVNLVTTDIFNGAFHHALFPL